MTDSLAYKIAFASLRGINRVAAEEFLARVGDEERFFNLSERQLASVMGFKNRLFDSDYRQMMLERGKREAEFVTIHNVRPLYFTDDDYPKRLADAADAPLMLFSLGNCDYNRGHFISVVGTRHATPYGLEFVNRLVENLSMMLSEPLTIVSGLAFGIDAAAHSAAMKRKMPTVGVLAHGLNTIYPARHRGMAAEMVRDGGALLTEYASFDPIHKGNFIARNRIVAALSDCVVVVESARKGGALITAGLASDYNRDVFALPGRISDRCSEGCNALIAENVAALVTDAESLAKAMNWPVRQQNKEQLVLFPELSAEERAVVDYITQHGEAQLNQIAIALNQNVGRMMSLLIDMEFKGLLITFPGGKYRLA